MRLGYVGRPRVLSSADEEALTTSLVLMCDDDADPARDAGRALEVERAERAAERDRWRGS